MDWKHARADRHKISRRAVFNHSFSSRKQNSSPHRLPQKNHDGRQQKRRRMHFIIARNFLNRFNSISCSYKRKNLQLPAKSFLLFIVLGFLFLFHRKIAKSFSFSRHSGTFHSQSLRPLLSDPILPLTIDFFSKEFENSSPFKFPSFSTLPPLKESRKKSPSFGKINYKPLLPDQDQRQILEKIDDKSGHVYTSEDFQDGNDDSIDPYYAFDDDNIRHPVCRRVSWHRLYHPSCNNFHELDMTQMSYMDNGYYRDVWAASYDDDEDIDVVLKSMRLKHKYRYDHYEFTRMDALVMERLTSAPSIVNIYGHCAVSVLTEALPTEFETTVIGNGGYLSGNTLSDTHDVDPKNDFTPTEKLNLALAMSEAIAELHGFKDGVIVHDDIQLCQFLYAKDGTLKLNDFNRAEVMLWDERQKSYCKYENGEVYGNYRAPEEFRDDLLDEKIDIFSLGNNFYGLLTGLWVFYDTEDDELVQKKIGRREKAFIDPRYRTRSYAERALVEIMERCWVYEPEKRADIFEVVKFLRNAVKENARLQQETQESKKTM